MEEIEGNLNYLLGRLSLVTQEFNKIKTELGSALDNIRSSFNVVQSKIQGESGVIRCFSLFSTIVTIIFCFIKDSGPGQTHKIDSDEKMQGPEFNLLPQRDAPAAP